MAILMELNIRLTS